MPAAMSTYMIGVPTFAAASNSANFPMKPENGGSPPRLSAGMKNSTATTGAAVRDAGGQAVVLGSYHPTFLYESLWCLGVAALLVWADRRFRLRPGQVFALYVMGYTLGRVWIEMMRVDQANHVLGLRLNVWTSLLVFAFGLAWFVLARRRSRSVSTTDSMESHTSE